MTIWQGDGGSGVLLQFRQGKTLRSNHTQL